VDFLHHGIYLDVEVGDDGVDVRRRSGRGLHGRERHGSGDQLLGGGLSFEIGGGGLLLIKELTGGQDAMTRGGGLLLGSFDSNDLSTTRASSRCLRTSASVAGRGPTTPRVSAVERSGSDTMLVERDCRRIG
jgi:hypothetical protein